MRTRHPTVEVDRDQADDQGTAASRRSRRAIIGGGLAAAGAGIAGTLFATASAEAADGDPLLVGETNQATNTTGLQNATGTCFEVSSASGNPVLSAIDTTPNSNGASPALSGQSPDSAGVVGSSDANAGVVGVSNSSDGVFGQSTSGVGVYGQLLTTSTTLGIAAVYGLDPTSAPGNTGVQGQSFNGTGVSGVANFPGGTGGDGVSGQTFGNGGYGVGAFDSSQAGGFGLLASTDNGIAVTANVSQQGNGTGWALQVNGPSQFITAGTAVVPKGQSSVTVNVASVTPASFVLATLQGTPIGDRYVQSAVAGNASVTIYLNASAKANSTVGFFALVPPSVAPPAASTRRLPTAPARRLARRRPVFPVKPKG